MPVTSDYIFIKSLTRSYISFITHFFKLKGVFEGKVPVRFRRILAIRRARDIITQIFINARTTCMTSWGRHPGGCPFMPKGISLRDISLINVLKNLTNICKIEIKVM